MLEKEFTFYENLGLANLLNNVSFWLALKHIFVTLRHFAGMF